MERRIAEKNTGIQKAVREETAGLKGEAHFEVMEAVYRRHHFHPIQNMLSGASFIFQLPFLLSAIVLFIRDDFLQDKSFLWLADLSRPDGWLLVGNFAVNVLPMLVLVIGIYDAFVFYADDVAARRKIYPYRIGAVCSDIQHAFRLGIVLVGAKYLRHVASRLMRLYMLREINICENAVSGAVIWLKGGHFYTVI